MARPIRIVIADDHQMFRQGLRRLLVSEDGLDLVGEAEDGHQLLELVAAHHPDVAIIDISMPGPGPEGILEQLEQDGSDCRALALTMHFEQSFAKEMLALGMSGYVVKEAAFDELVTAIRAVAGGDHYLCKALLEPRSPDEAAGVNLTEREMTCLRAAAEGLTGKMIARQIGITERTVRFHFSNICRKFGVQRRSEAVADALRQRIIAL